MSRHNRYHPGDAGRALDTGTGWLVRLVVLVGGGALLYTSYILSVEGFGIESPRYKWVGNVISFAIIGMELAFQEHRLRNNPTVIVLALLSYTYGIYTNYLGMWQGMGMPSWATHDGTLQNTFAACVGFIMEFAPEPMIMYGLLGPSEKGDFLGAFMDGLGSLDLRGLGRTVRRTARDLVSGLKGDSAAGGRSTNREIQRRPEQERGLIVPDQSESYAALAGPEAGRLYCEFDPQRGVWVFFRAAGDGDNDWQEAYTVPDGGPIQRKLRDASYGWISKTEYSERYPEE